MSFLPKNYELPNSGSIFMKLAQGENKIRIVSDVVVGFEYWTGENKPVRLREMPKSSPQDIKINEDGTLSGIKHFWALIVIDRQDEEAKLLMITQASIMSQLNDLLENPDWGDPKGYDLTITRKGENLKTKYSIQPSLKKKLTEEEKKIIENAGIDPALILFKEEKPKDKPKEDDEVKIEDIPL